MKTTGFLLVLVLGAAAQSARAAGEGCPIAIPIDGKATGDSGETVMGSAKICKDNDQAVLSVSWTTAWRGLNKDGSWRYMTQKQIAGVRYELHEQNVAPAFDGVGVGPNKSMFQDPGTYDLIDALYAHYWTNQWIKNPARSYKCTSKSSVEAKDADGSVLATAQVCVVDKAVVGISWQTKLNTSWRWVSEDTLRVMGYSAAERVLAAYEADENGQDGNFGPTLYSLSDIGTFTVLDDIYTHQKTAEKLPTMSKLVPQLSLPTGGFDDRAGL